MSFLLLKTNLKSKRSPAEAFKQVEYFWQMTLTTAIRPLVFMLCEIRHTTCTTRFPTAQSGVSKGSLRTFELVITDKSLQLLLLMKLNILGLYQLQIDPKRLALTS